VHLFGPDSEIKFCLAYLTINEFNFNPEKKSLGLASILAQSGPPKYPNVGDEMKINELNFNPDLKILRSGFN
jgi:hypothetical protein